MLHQLHFAIKERFRTTHAGIIIPFSLTLNGATAFGRAKIDTGSKYCLFQRELAEELGLEVEDGLPVRLNTLTGDFTAHAHTVMLNTFEISFESTVLLTAGYGTNRNILGRRGSSQ